MGASATAATCSKTSSSAAISARVPLRLRVSPTFSRYSPSGASTRSTWRANSSVRRWPGVCSPAKTSRITMSREASLRDSVTARASPGRIRSSGARGRSSHSRTRVARAASSSTTTWRACG